MPRVAISADAYASTRVGIFFPAHNQTPADGNLTGQCVTLNKWFLAEMTEVPNPFIARGDARYVGKRLVAEGHAVEIAYDQRQPGDFVVYEYGTYGHIGVLLTGDRIFEQNVNVGGVARKLVDGAYVYASRVGSLNESWRPIRPNIYRIKSYGGNMNPSKGDVDNILGELWGRSPNPEDYGYTNQSWHDFIYGAMAAYPWRNRYHVLQVLYPQAVKDRDTATGIANTRSANFQRICDSLGVVRLPDEQATTDLVIAKIEQLYASSESVQALTKKVDDLTKENEALKAQLATSGSDTELLNSFGKLLQQLIVRLGIKK